MRLTPRLTLASAVLTAAGAAHAQSGSQHVDVNPYDGNGAEPGGKILTGFFDVDTDAFVEDIAVFAEPLEIIQSSFHGVSAPGFFATGDFVLLPSADVSFDVPAVSAPIGDTPRTLFYWDGLDANGNGDLLDDVAFTAPPAGHGLEVRLSSFVNMTVTGGSTDQPGFVLDRTNATGGLHKHVSFLVRGDAGGAPDDGLYLLPFRLHQPGLESSDPFFLLYNGKYERDGNDEIIFDGILPRVDLVAQAAAEVWLDAALSDDPSGDYNDSGLWEQGDLDLVLSNWGDPFDNLGNTGGWINQRPTEGIVDQAELDVVLTGWGTSAAPAFTGHAVPEPALLVGLPVLGILHRPTRRVFR